MQPELVNKLLDEPNVAFIIEKIQVALANEAERRKAFYDWIKEDQKAEFINGEIIMHSPVKRSHLNVVGNLFRLLSVYVISHDLGQVDSEKALISLSRNDYEPDICFWGKEKASHFHVNQMQHPAPDLIVEVLSRGTEERDRGVKFKDYAAHGVTEYWIVDPIRETVEKYLLDIEVMEYEPQMPVNPKQYISSDAVQGFTIPFRAIFDQKINLDVLQSLMK
ncbi:Uma2 family endonuclease [Dyadobacter psychrotolerans]|uniref:Uma2 family endonuclease n=1 Tax=Dyadobacter psychrotolerans TaxID=2541721 RepID=A0A4R5DV69_9BACT|nr:Uma2 family endonuclease [Dyadobacter psychrotolerans]TDE16250.1 Uma2 family endonuclease [Dyadobacter psychrotolerans]